ncbi:sensor histidine kinase [Mucilaginibacter sp.]|uniref:sensor histidine kinase n=1 Tax=Mucilaginibacter sp. TaxID=1882438 RepID=UPI000CAD72D7|nr:ATP-binding protein [Mucilaginibacter sp.]PLW89274.1 MAG: histidine kinase [Mucilaginibacter sp.]HEK19204.1 sensor histidine kinase [Bacteroidota bacterium]
MSAPGKIRVLLALLFASLLFTAIAIESTYTPANNLEQTAKLLENNLHKKENFIYQALGNKTVFNEIKNLRTTPQKGIQYINEFTSNRSIWLLVYKKGVLSFWSGAKIIPPNAVRRIKEGCSFIKQPNGYYEAIRKTDGETTVMFFIPVKGNYPFTNEYLTNVFARDLTTDRNIAIADFTDKEIYPVHDVNGVYLFSLKLAKGVNHRFFYLVVGFWIMAIIALCILINSVAQYIARKNAYLALLFLAGSIVAIRAINLWLGIPTFTQQLSLFNPQVYASSAVFRSLGDFCINILFLCWFAGFAYIQRNRLITKTPGKPAGYAIYVFVVLSLIGTAQALLSAFYGLVINSKISFDVNNILNLSEFSYLGVLMLCFAFLLFFLLGELVITICLKLAVPLQQQVFGLFLGVLLATLINTYYWEFSLFHFLWMLLILIRGYAHLYHGRRFTAPTFISVILLCTVISASKLSHFEQIKEKGMRKVLIQRLEMPDDAIADGIFNRIENDITKDSLLISYYKNPNHSDDYLETGLKKQYFDQYLSKYDFDVHEYGPDGQPVSVDKSYSLDVFKDMVVYNSFKVSKYFYRENESFGFQSYFAMLPVVDGNTNLGTIVIELKSKTMLTPGAFPDLLIDKQVKGSSDEFKNYSFAFYADNRLVAQSGTYVYSLRNNEFGGKIKTYTTQVTQGNKNGMAGRFTTYSHLLYKPSERNLIVVTREDNAILSSITALTFFFVVLLSFSTLLILLRLLWIRVKILTVSNNRIKWAFKINFDKILYRTRIQFSMIFAVVITLILVGIITFVSISSQYQSQQETLIRTKILQIAAAFEVGPLTDRIQHINEQAQINFDELANTYSADLSLFDVNGALLMSTQPKIYDYGLQARQMNGRAFINLHGLQKSEILNEEKIGLLNYKAAYTPIRNIKHETIAYLQLPYFANEADYTERIGSLLNIMINVYALVFIAIGLFAVIIARQITAPLNFIQYSLSKTIYGKKNEPIKWNRDDEIGALVKEYNNMIAALEQSAQKLAQSERESAWREMAKQVAHEIKNPLTPLKLGLQLLDKSWKDKDPKFDQKFERFSKSFVEQIESLSSIASEFSAFAKMPDTRIERINIFDILNQATTIFKQMDNVQITYQAPEQPFMVDADRDQLLRCFNNLLKNAIEATPEDKRCEIDINYLITSKNILLTIKDNGSGIPENMREKIFEPNFTTKSSGTGLGLAFVKNSIENANGKVWFDTVIDIGTTFYLSFPASAGDGGTSGTQA